jgi:hypothetical protein
MVASELIKMLGQRVGVDSLSLDTGECAISFDGDEIYFTYAENILFAVADLGDEINDEKVFETLLAANFKGLFTSGAIIGLDAERGCFTLSLLFEDECEYDFFENKLAEFVKTLRMLKQFLAEKRS